MKATQEKIHLSELLNCYSLEQLRNYQQCPRILCDEIRDIQTLSELALSQFAELVVDLRKKSLEYDKTFKVCDKLAKEILMEVQARRTQCNKNFAYSIHSLNAQTLVPQFPQRRLLTELKLKFLESQEVDERHWEDWFCPEEKVLKIKDRNKQFEIKLGIGLTEEKSPALSWQIYDVTSNSHHHAQFFFFLIEYVHWMRTSVQDWESKLINNLRLILDNLPTIYLFLTMREEVRRRGGEIDRETLKLTLPKSGNLKFVWNFNIFECIEQPKVTCLINEDQAFLLNFKRERFWGEITIRKETEEVVLKPTAAVSLHNRYFLYEFSLKVHSYRINAQKFQEKYHMLSSSYGLFLNLEGHLWKPDGFVIEKQSNINSNSDGFWGQITSENRVIFKIEDDLSLTYPGFERGFFGHLLSKLALPDLLTHIHLRNEISRNNKEFQFKIYRVNFLEREQEITYEFRSYKYSEQQKIFKIAKADEETMHLISEANDNFVLIMRLAADFSKVTYSAYKAMEGPQQQREVTDNFLPRRWKEYRDKTRGIYDWRKICECVSYLCKCYLVERSYNRRMTEEQKKMTVYSFK